MLSDKPFQTLFRTRFGRNGPCAAVSWLWVGCWGKWLKLMYFSCFIICLILSWYPELIQTFYRTQDTSKPHSQTNPGPHNNDWSSDFILRHISIDNAYSSHNLYIFLGKRITYQLPAHLFTPSTYQPAQNWPTYLINFKLSFKTNMVEIPLHILDSIV